eukprot:GHUV01025975.1.p1 GENE.GHUV01025975.1~~GHUV01025975.1.p1  ORF type:complete len:113 (-),score=14.30 GHUV01025975.1:174-512(-)
MYGATACHSYRSTLPQQAAISCLQIVTLILPSCLTLSCFPHASPTTSLTADLILRPAILVNSPGTPISTYKAATSQDHETSIFVTSVATIQETAMERLVCRRDQALMSDVNS